MDEMNFDNDVHVYIDKVKELDRRINKLKDMIRIEKELFLEEDLKARASQGAGNHNG